MKVLVVGSGGREHALSWKLAKSARVTKVFTAPGNPGTAEVGENVNIQADDIGGLMDFVETEGIDLTVVGPEVPLSMGIIDKFECAGFKAFGPKHGAAEIESSKVFCKYLLKKYNIPTAAYGEFSDAREAAAYIRERGAPLVVKADGLAAGKGVFLCFTEDEAHSAVTSIMEDKLFGDAGEKIIIEEFLEGEEASYIAVTDWTTVVPLATSQDHKAIFDGDKGPNTGGMGAYSPAPVVTKELEAHILKDIMLPTLHAMEAEGRPFKGILYAGLMIKDGSAKVLEFNCRFGDPEAQPLLMRLKSDLFDLLMASVDGELEGVELEWEDSTAVCVVMSSRGYPGSYDKGAEISGIKEAESAGDGSVKVFHAGTREEGGKLVTSGGRVLGVTALAPDVAGAIDKAYGAVGLVSFDGAYSRTDIGKKALG
ncbi:MAG: phosphoribosylamine--glycine ligase [Thermodesulfobacteriota bacterium]